jgi:hypothetical protein
LFVVTPAVKTRRKNSSEFNRYSLNVVSAHKKYVIRKTQSILDLEQVWFLCRKIYLELYFPFFVEYETFQRFEKAIFFPLFRNRFFLPCKVKSNQRAIFSKKQQSQFT